MSAPSETPDHGLLAASGTCADTRHEVRSPEAARLERGELSDDEVERQADQFAALYARAGRPFPDLLKHWSGTKDFHPATLQRILAVLSATIAQAAQYRVAADATGGRP